MPRAPQFDLDHLISRLQRCPATYLVGAGASAPEVPFGRHLDCKIMRGHVLAGSFRPVTPAENSTTRRIIGSYSYRPGFGLHPLFDREMRPGTDDDVPALLKLLSPDAAHVRMMRELALSKYSGRQIDGNRIFRAFHPGLIMSYNVDGLVAWLRGSQHHVVEVHGSIPAEFGGPGGARWVKLVHEYGVERPRVSVILDNPERDDDPVLLSKMAEIWRFSPKNVVIIGYTFGRKESGYHDDWVSLNEFTRRYRHFRGDIFVIDPRPHPLRETLADKLASVNVYAIPAYWNILAGAFVEASSGRSGGPSLRYRHELILDKYGSDAARSRWPARGGPARSFWSAANLR